MENNDGNIKPQQTGGLKLMTVFIAVLALHVVVIGGITVYNLMKGGGTDGEITLDKTHLKADGSVATDGTAPDIAKSASTDTATTAATPTGPTDDSATASTQVTPAPASPAPVKVAPTVATAAPMPPSSTPAPVPAPATEPGVPTPSSVVIAPPASSGMNSLAPPPDSALSAATPVSPIVNPTPTMSAPVESAPIASSPAAPVAAPVGPVHMPAPAAPALAPTHDVAATHASAPTHEVAAAPSHEAAPAAKKEFYTVKITDSYKKIAKAHHVTVAQLKEANHIKDSTLHTGQKLVIPAPTTAIAKADADSKTNLAASPASAKSHHKYYTVEKGDTLGYIAKKFNTTKAAILSANDLSHPAKLTPGQKLKIPASAKEARSAAISVPTHLAPTPVTPIVPVAPMAPVAAPAPAPQPVATQPTSPETEPTPELANMTF